MSETRAGWYERINKYGKQAVILEEMLRLGFWPPSTTAAAEREEALKVLEVEYAELSQLRADLGKIEKQLADSQNIEALIAEIRKRRIERVRAQRAVRKIEKAQQQADKQTAIKAEQRERPPFLGHEVSAGLRYEGGDAAKVAKLNLPVLQTGGDVARAIGIDEGKLAWLTYHRAAASVDHYHRFTLPKRSGGTRIISAPKPDLRIAQSWLLNSILSKLEIHAAAMAFRPGRSILDNAQVHQQQAVVIRLDLKDFFPGISFNRVKGLFEAFGYNQGVATILALLATEAPRVAVTLDGVKRFVSTGQRHLPQGACTSPALTNVLCRSLDKRLIGAARRYGFNYTRYADDLVFSHAQTDALIGQFLGLVRQIIKAEGFIVNEEKTRIMRAHQRQAVTGLVVNETPQISRYDMRRFRAFLHHCEVAGTKAVSEKLGKNALSYARGYLAFIQMVSPDKVASIKKAHPWL